VQFKCSSVAVEAQQPLRRGEEAEGEGAYKEKWAKAEEDDVADLHICTSVTSPLPISSTMTITLGRVGR
jgi:hypothetical protein